MDIKELNSGINLETNWYYQSKKEPLLNSFIRFYNKTGKPVEIVDFGAGSGFFSYEILAKFPNLVKKIHLVDTEYSPEEIENTFGSEVIKTNTIPLNLQDTFIMMMDVIEHIEDDKEILLSIKKHAISNCYFFITVPAFMSLWSKHDVFLEHFRRYNNDSMTSLLKSADYKVENQYFLFGFIFPLVFIVRKINQNKTNVENNSDLKPLPNVVNFLLKTVCTLEMKISKYNKFFGVTLVSEGFIKNEKY